MKRLPEWILLLGVLLGCAHKKPPVLLAFSDGAATFRELELYQDQTFCLYLPAREQRGTYPINGETIRLEYSETAERPWPGKFLIEKA
jgi:hypothetical protein